MGKLSLVVVMGELFWCFFVLFKIQALKITMKKYIKSPENRLIHTSYNEENFALDKKVYFILCRIRLMLWIFLYLYLISKIITVFE